MREHGLVQCEPSASRATFGRTTVTIKHGRKAPPPFNSRPSALQDLPDIDRFWGRIAHVECLFDVVQVLFHQLGGALLVADSERVEQRVVLGLRASARTV